MTVDCSNAFSGEPDESFEWKGRKINMYNSEAHGAIFFDSETGEEIEFSGFVA